VEAGWRWSAEGKGARFDAASSTCPSVAVQSSPRRNPPASRTHNDANALAPRIKLTASLHAPTLAPLSPPLEATSHPRAAEEAFSLHPHFKGPQPVTRALSASAGSALSPCLWRGAYLLRSLATSSLPRRHPSGRLTLAGGPELRPLIPYPLSLSSPPSRPAPPPPHRRKQVASSYISVRHYTNSPFKRSSCLLTHQLPSPRRFGREGRERDKTPSFSPRARPRYGAHRQRGNQGGVERRGGRLPAQVSKRSGAPPRACAPKRARRRTQRRRGIRPGKTEERPHPRARPSTRPPARPAPHGCATPRPTPARANPRHRARPGAALAAAPPPRAPQRVAATR
jgi:hypothetical protein